METTQTSDLASSELDRRAQSHRAVIASTIASTIAWYDFALFGVMSDLVFPQLYFSSADPWLSPMAGFSIFTLGLFAQLAGAVHYGTDGDSLFGRKDALTGALLLTSVATFVMALVPTYEQIGVWGAIILTTLRGCGQGA
jgi:MFS family permease